MAGMKKIFLDENMRNAKLIQKLRKLGYKLVFTPQGVSDYDLEDWLVTKDDIVMITKDIEFDLKFVENKSFLIDESESVNDCVILIDAFMSQFKK
jgi:hypothetical protein